MKKTTPLFLHTGQLRLACCVCMLFSWWTIRGQCPTRTAVWDSLMAIEKSARPASIRLQQVSGLRQVADRCHFAKDSIYARILHRVGLYEYNANDNIATASAVETMLEAARINSAEAPDRSKGFVMNSYFNLGLFYKTLGMLSRSLNYFDTCIAWSQKAGTVPERILQARYNKVQVFRLNGDYQKCIDEATIGIAEAVGFPDRYYDMSLLNQRAWALMRQGDYRQAMVDADSAIAIRADTFELASAYKTKALLYGYQRQTALARSLFTQAIRLRQRTADYTQIANDYVDLGNFYQNTLGDPGRATAAYDTSLSYAVRAANKEAMAKAYTDLGAVNFRQAQYDRALQRYASALATLTGFTSNQDLLLTIYINKVDAAIHLYRQNKDRAWLDLSLQTALLTDSLITVLRHQQMGERSKLYWRNKSREIFANALDACFFSDNTSLAFFFMEKSRAVILNDKLNELGAQARLPAKEAQLERQLEISLTSQQQRLAAIPPDSPAYAERRLLMLREKEKLEQYIHGLEDRYPAYYQYKYSDTVASLAGLHRYLASEKASFLHFFTTDSVVYVLRIDSAGNRLFRLAGGDAIQKYTRFCADGQAQNTHHAEFVSASHRLYHELFRPLSVAAGRVIVCSDEFLLPFDALYEDSLGRRPLLYDYAFSYVYSARTLMNSRAVQPARGNFIGFAPVSFSPGLHLADLRLSADSLRSAAAAYRLTDLYTNGDATRGNFLDKMPAYAIANVFSHARADSGDSEPVLFMQDSLIHLSELQLISFPATQLVVLSACQTGAGRNASGEGVYSLARGFASAGIPAVAATLWEADESAIYALTGRFHYYLSRGEPKDIALQKAKIDYIRSSGRQGSLPWYWASLVITGSTEPVRLHNPVSRWWWIGAIAVVLAAGGWSVATGRRSVAAEARSVARRRAK